MWLDPVWFVFLAPAMLFALWAQFRVKSAYAQASRIPAESGYTGAQAADALLRAAGVAGVQIEPVQGFMADHYVPGQHVLRLSPDVYSGRSLASLGIAAHEAGHALQEAGGYAPLAIRNGLVPLASVGSGFSWLIIFVGFMFHLMGVVLLGILAFSVVVLFQLVNLPVEYNASRRARLALVDAGLVSREEDIVVSKVLNAAALTYVAATVSSIMTLLYFLFRSGLLGGRRN